MILSIEVAAFKYVCCVHAFCPSPPEAARARLIESGILLHGQLVFGFIVHYDCPVPLAIATPGPVSSEYGVCLVVLT